MLLLIVGVEGSGHHALHALLRSAEPSVSLSMPGRDNARLGSLSARLELEVLERSKRWTRLASVPRTTYPRKSSGWIQPVAVIRQSPVVGVGELPKNRTLIGGEEAALCADSKTWVVIDSSIPFYGGWDRDSLLYLDFVGMADFLSPETTRVLFLNRSPEMASLSIYRRTIEATLERACRSTFHSSLVAAAAVATLEEFRPIEVIFEDLCKDPEKNCSMLEEYLGLSSGILDPGVVVPSTTSPTMNECAILTEYWTSTRKELLRPRKRID